MSLPPVLPWTESLRPAALRTLLNIRAIQEVRMASRGENIINAFTASGPSDVSPFTRNVNAVNARFRPAITRLNMSMVLHS